MAKYKTPQSQYKQNSHDTVPLTHQGLKEFFSDPMEFLQYLYYLQRYYYLLIFIFFSSVQLFDEIFLSILYRKSVGMFKISLTVFGIINV